MLITLQNLSLKLGEKQVFNSLSFSFKPDSFYVVKGESGCGKTTLLKCISSLLEPDSGEIVYSSELSIVELRRKIQYLPQLPVIFEGSIKENLLKPFSFKPYNNHLPSDDELKARMSELFSEEIDLEKNADKLSQGEKQRMALCRALLINPDILLCDEPTASLNTKSRKVVEEKIKSFSDSGNKTVIFISHHDELLIDKDITELLVESGKIREVK